jgi:hypothetical protein
MSEDAASGRGVVPFDAEGTADIRPATGPVHGPALANRRAANPCDRRVDGCRWPSSRIPLRSLGPGKRKLVPGGTTFPVGG